METVAIPQRIQLTPISTTDNRQVGINIKRSSKYPRVTWGHLRYPICAVVGGGPSVRHQLDMLRGWEGDIFAVNDTAGYLSDNGIKCYLYSIDGSDVPYRVGENVLGALFASRCHKKQFSQIKKMDKPIRVFDLTEDCGMKGIEGGVTGVCRTPHLLLSMGYRGIAFFGVDGSFDGEMTHASGESESAHDNMIIVRACGNDYLTHAGFMLQNEWLCGYAEKYPQFIDVVSGGLLPAMIADPDGWSVVAVAEDLKQKYEAGGNYVWSKMYDGGNSWQQPQASSPQPQQKSE